MIGTKLAHYEITSHLGSGGMGDVYQATDTKLGRRVAIKFLPDAFRHDAARVERFQREARVLALLNHPHIAGIYGLEESGEQKFLVMELVGGETLAERIKRGPVPVDASLQIATQICEALEAAHEKGIVHRDLKPANIKVTSDGKVKVLDFGLAKAYEAEPSKTNLSQSPTLSMAATSAGVILGTAAYMSPEQARGEHTDARSDVFSLGCVLYEMLSGQQAFQGKTVSDILAGVLRVEPDFTSLPPDLNPRLLELLRRCLDKNPKRRWQAVGDLKIELETVAADPHRKPEVAAHAAPGRRRLERVLWISSLAAVSMIAAAAFIWTSRGTPPAGEMRVEISTPATDSSETLAISPDGQKIVFAAGPPGRSLLWLRSLDSLSARPLAGTDNANGLFWSPDSRTVAFFAQGKLKRIDIEGGSARVLADAGNARGGTWNRDGVILFAPNPAGPLFRVSATGGQPSAVTRIDAAQQISHRFPKFLPDGSHFLYYVQGSRESNGVYVGALDGSSTPRLFDADAAAVYASSGHLLFVLQGTLFAQRFDPDKLALMGDPIPVADQIAENSANQEAALSASAAGPVVYRTGSESPRQLVWMDRSGREIEKLGAPDPTSPRNPSLSLDGRRVALDRTVNGNTDVWILELERSVLSRFTFDEAVDSAPVWSPDSNQIIFASRRKGVRDLYQKPVRGAGSEELLLATPETKDPVDWSPDGRFFLYGTVDPRTGNDIWALPIGGADRKPFPVVQTNFNEHSGQFSPDGKWIAYQSSESGRYEIYIQLFPGPGGKTQISTSGGRSPRWRRDSKELFYIGADDKLMAVPITFASNGQTLEPGAPVPLFVTHTVRPGYDNWDYVAAPDGQRFLMNTPTEETVTSPVVLLMNWKPKP
jgi:eukaryotic-like serine/threonine-protein kinase